MHANSIDLIIVSSYHACIQYNAAELVYVRKGCYVAKEGHKASSDSNSASQGTKHNSDQV